MLRRHLGQVLRRLAGQKESLIEEGHLRSRACDDLEVFCGAGDRVHQREKRPTPQGRESAMDSTSGLAGIDGGSG